jgi:hypothetical protein
MKFDRTKNRYLSQDGFDYLSGDVKEQPIYNPDKFHSSAVDDFDIVKPKNAPF